MTPDSKLLTVCAAVPCFASKCFLNSKQTFGELLCVTINYCCVESPGEEHHDDVI